MLASFCIPMLISTSEPKRDLRMLMITCMLSACADCKYEEDAADQSLQLGHVYLKTRFCSRLEYKPVNEDAITLSHCGTSLPNSAAVSAPQNGI